MQLIYNISLSNSQNFNNKQNSFPTDAITRELASRAVELDKFSYATTNYYPSDGALLGLAAVVYADVKVLTEPKDVTNQAQLNAAREGRLPEIAQSFLMNYSDDAHDPLVWKCILRVYDEESKHAAVVYLHKQQPHLVIAFKGSQVLGDWVENFSEIARNNITKDSQYSAARTWIEKYFLPVLKHPEIFGKYSVSLTGHSLGGWLANAALKDCEEAGFHFHLVTVDNPGPYPMLQDRLTNDVAPDVAISDSDRTVYLSEPDLVNTGLQHVPSTRRLFPALSEGYAGKYTLHTFDAHDMTLLLNCFDAYGQPKEYADVLNWPQLTPPKDLAVKPERTTWRVFFSAAAAYFSNSSAALGFDSYNRYFEEVRTEIQHREKIAKAARARGEQVSSDYEVDGSKRFAFPYTSENVKNNAYLEYSVRYKTRRPDPQLYNLAILNAEEIKFLKLMLQFVAFLPGFIDDYLRDYALDSALLSGCQLIDNRVYDGVRVLMMRIDNSESGHRIINFIKQKTAEHNRAKANNLSHGSPLQEIRDAMQRFIQSKFESAEQMNEKLTQFSNIVSGIETDMQNKVDLLREQLAEQEALRDKYGKNMQKLAERIGELEKERKELVGEKTKIGRLIVANDAKERELNAKKMSVMNALAVTMLGDMQSKQPKKTAEATKKNLVLDDVTSEDRAMKLLSEASEVEEAIVANNYEKNVLNYEDLSGEVSDRMMNMLIDSQFGPGSSAMYSAAMPQTTTAEPPQNI